MALFLDMAVQIRWDEMLDDFTTMLHDEYLSQVLLAETNKTKRIIVDWNSLNYETQDFIMSQGGEYLELMIKEMEERLKLDTNYNLKLGFKNFPDMIDIERCSENIYSGKLVQIEGVVGSISTPLSYTSKIFWRCKTCDTEHVINYDFFDRASTKSFCPNCRRFTFNEKIDEEKVNFQILEMVRPVLIAGKTPDALRVILKEDLCEFGDVQDPELLAGNRTKIIGINKDFPAYKESVRRRPYIDAMNWMVEKEFLELTKDDLKKIKRFAKSKKLIETLIKSVAPSIIGGDEIKLSVLLQAVGGVSRERADKTLRRGTIHVLLIGDPASSKTTIGIWVNRHIAKSRYVVASAVTQAGLGASLQRDEKLGVWYLNAGALLLAGGSLAIIDEFDKAGGDDLNQLDMVMENEMLTITKIRGGNFPARTSVLGLGNPKFGRFDPLISLSEQINIQAQTLSRFDLKFALIDTPDEEKDEAIIKSKFIQIQPELKPEFLTKYLYYARKIEPKMNKKCEERIIKFYKDLRQKTQGIGGVISITPRQADTILRLSEAFAKLRLDDKIKMDDVDNAIKMISAYLRTFGFDMTTGDIDIDLVEGRQSKSKRDMMYKVLDIIKDKTKITQMIHEDEIVKACGYENLDANFVIREAIPFLKNSGDIYSPKLRYWGIVKG
jgi:replicative DNA helicase Mcm